MCQFKIEVMDTKALDKIFNSLEIKLKAYLSRKEKPYYRKNQRW